MTFQLTEEQQSIVASMADPEPVIVQAYAGTAKTTSILAAAPSVRVPALALAFNKKIADDLRGRLPANWRVMTLNGLGQLAWARALPPRVSIEIDEKKLGRLVSEISKDNKVEISSDQWAQVRGLVGKAMLAGLSPGNIGQPFVEDSEASWRDLAFEAWIGADDQPLLCDLARQVLIASIEEAKKGRISFDEQIYCPTILGGQWPKFPAAAGDETQDWSRLNQRMFALATREDAKLLLVGDPKQCHPPGTMISLPFGRSVSIEDLSIGTELVSYNRKVGLTGLNGQGRKVVSKEIFEFDGHLIRIMAEGSGRAHSCTPNHRCMVKWKEKESYVVYLMRRGNNYRIGTAQSWYKGSNVGGNFGPTMRARQEKSDAMWILDVFDTKEQALINEKVIWTMFGLPDLIFHCSGGASSTQDHLNQAWNQIGDNSSRAKQCLNYYKREFEFPFWTPEMGKHFGIEMSFITEACNLISGAMSVKTDVPGEWTTAWISYEQYKGPVIGITVEENGYGRSLYIANGIVTHNSIYGWRGADAQAMNSLRLLRPSWSERRLTLSFRCPRRIVARQQAHAPGFKAAAGNREGRFEQFQSSHDEERFPVTSMQMPGWTWQMLRQLGAGPVAVLCRNNAPLLSLAFKLLRQQIAPTFLGRDIGKGLLGLSRRISKADNVSSEIFLGRLSEWEAGEIAQAQASGEAEARLDSISDRADSLRAIAEGAECRTAGEIRSALSLLFQKESGDAVLSTIHRAKGLEWDLVLHLDPWRIPSRQAKAAARGGQPGALEQEWNLKYVAETRTRDVLVQANLEDFRSPGGH